MLRSMTRTTIATLLGVFLFSCGGDKKEVKAKAKDEAPKEA